MTFLSWIVEGPDGSKWAGVKMRLAALTVQDYPEEDKLKVVLQVMVDDRPDALHPIAVDWLSRPALDNYVEESILEGWKISKDVVKEDPPKLKTYDNAAYHREYRKRCRESGIYPPSKRPKSLRDQTHKNKAPQASNISCDNNSNVFIPTE